MQMNVFLLRVFNGGLALLLFCSGCTKTPSPEAALESLPARVAQRLLQEARQEALQGRYQEAAFLLTRFLNSYPSSSLSDEAQWWLARSYQQIGSLHLALKNYRFLAQSDKKNTYQALARRQVAKIEKILGLSYSEQSLINATLISIDQIQRADVLKTIVERSSRMGRTTIVLDLGCQKVFPLRSSIDESSKRVIKWGRLIKEVVDPLVAQSHQQKLSVYVSVTLRCLGQFKQKRDNAWSDWVFDPSSRELQISPFYSIFYQGYQSYLRSRLSELAKAKIDGLIFRAQAPLGPYEGFSPLAIQSFEKAFEASLDPKQLFPSSRKPRPIAGKNSRVSKSRFADHYAPIFWRWTGWKARERLIVFKKIRESLHTQFPNLRFGLELHQMSVQYPVAALANYGEDWVEAAQSGFEFVVIKPIGKKNALLTRKSQKMDSADFAWTIPKTIKEMIKFLINPQKIWVILPYTRNLVSRENAQRSQPLGEAGFLRKVGKIYKSIQLP